MLILAIIVIVFSLVLVLRKTHSAKKLPQPPTIPGALPILGHTHLIFGKTDRFLEIFEGLIIDTIKIGGVGVSRLGPRAGYVITDPDIALTALNNSHEKDIFYRMWKEWLGDGLLLANEDVWRQHRKFLNPVFNQKILEGFLGTFNSQARRFVQKISVEVGKGAFDHWPATILNYMETLCLTSVGFKEDEKTLNLYTEALKEVHNITMTRFETVWMHSDFLYKWSNLKKREDRALKIIHGISAQMIHKRKTFLELNNLKRQKMTESDNFEVTNNKMLLDAILDSPDGVYSEEQIRHELDMFLFAGHDTTAATVVYAAVMLGSHPEVQDKVYAELQSVLQDPNEDVNRDHLSKLIYMEAVLKETMRLYPIVPFVIRNLDKDVQLENYTLSSNSSCFVLIIGIHRSPAWGPDADQFRPERWLDRNTLPESPGAFLAFSSGKRGCIGKQYAMTVMKTVLAHMLRSYRITADHTQMKLKMDVMLKPLSGHHISIERR